MIDEDIISYLKGVNPMTKYIENVNAYMSQMKIKQTYVSMKTGIDTKKLSRILTGAQDVSGTDMEKISGALGQKTAFFLEDRLNIPQIQSFEPEKIAFYAGKPTGRQAEIAEKLVKLMENVDEVLSARYRLLDLSGE